MAHKFFPLDKNYILKQVQADTEDLLIDSLIKKVISTYLTQFNPLGLEDDAVLKIKNCSCFNLEALRLFYEELSIIYRYKNNEIQLELLFDGRSHYEKYKQEWSEVFGKWIANFCEYGNFIKAVLECAVIYQKNRINQLAQARMKYFLTKYFEVKVYRYKGIQEYKSA